MTVTVEKIILGVDPGTNVMGYGVLRVIGRKTEMLALGIIDLRKFGDHYLKLGRAQGVAMAAAIERQVPITEYAPTKIKMAITGNGNASKEQVADMLRRMLRLESCWECIASGLTDGRAGATASVWLLQSRHGGKVLPRGCWPTRLSSSGRRDTAI